MIGGMKDEARMKEGLGGVYIVGLVGRHGYEDSSGELDRYCIDEVRPIFPLAHRV